MDIDQRGSRVEDQSRGDERSERRGTRGDYGQFDDDYWRGRRRSDYDRFDDDYGPGGSYGRFDDRYRRQMSDDYGRTRRGMGDRGAGGYDPNERYGGIGRMGGYGQQGGPHTGHGPRGYQRSDDRIREDVCEALTQHGQLDAREIEVTVQGGEVTLTGSVDSRQAKRMAEDAADQCQGVRDVHNQIRVSQSQGDQSQDRQRAVGDARP